MCYLYIVIKENKKLLKLLTFSITINTLALSLTACESQEEKDLLAQEEADRIALEDAKANNKLPVIRGAKDLYFEIGVENPNLITNITITDAEDIDLTDKVQVEHNIDFNVAGKYAITYKGADSLGGKREISRNVFITPKEPKTTEGYSYTLEHDISILSF